MHKVVLWIWLSWLFFTNFCFPNRKVVLAPMTSSRCAFCRHRNVFKALNACDSYLMSTISSWSDVVISVIYDVYINDSWRELKYHHTHYTKSIGLWCNWLYRAEMSRNSEMLYIAGSTSLLKSFVYWRCKRHNYFTYTKFTKFDKLKMQTMRTVYVTVIHGFR